VAQQIVIDIVAETKKLTEGFNEIDKEVKNVSGKLKGLTSAAATAASAFVLKQGVTFLKQGIEEAKDAKVAMQQATTTFGAGSAALKKITDDAEKFGKELAIDNDEIIVLATQLGSRLPKEVQASSAELVKIFKDVEAFTGGAVAAEAASGKLAKAFADGKLKAGELQKIFPGLEQATYDQAEALSAAGKNQEALNLLVETGSKKYDDAAAKNVTATQKFDTALANFKETLGNKVLPVLEQALGFLTKLLEAFDKQPDWLKNFELGLLAIVGIGGPLISFVANLQASLVQLGLIPAASGAAAIGLNLVRVALAGLGIGLVIAAIVLLIQHWDDLSKVAKEVGEKVAKFIGDMVDKVKDFLGDAVDWIKENWPKILAVLTGPFGLFILWVVTYKDDIVAKFKEVWETVKTAVTEKVTAIIDAVKGLWNGLKDFIIDYFSDKAESFLGAIKNGWNTVKETVSNIVEIIKLTVGVKFLEMFTKVTEVVSSIKTGVVDKFNELKDKAIEKFNELKTAASKVWDNISGYIKGVATNIKEKLDTVYSSMVEVGKDIAYGIAKGLSDTGNFMRTFLTEWVNNNILKHIKTIMGIKSPSTVMAKIGEQLTEGLYVGMGLPGKPGITLPQINVGGNGVGTGINITINAGLGTDPYALGREVSNAIRKYGNISIKGI
jgi:hypothetical protein